jgi:lysophospholipase L1-like esterase
VFVLKVKLIPMKQIFLLVFFIVIAFSLASGQTRLSRYEEDLAKFRDLDSISPPELNNILFIGSSSFTLWKDMNDCFPGYPILNRAYGGSCLTDIINDFDRLVLPYHPRQVVIYCGENDFASDTALAPQVVVERFRKVFMLLRVNFPTTRITYVSMKPSPKRWFLKDKFISANQEIRIFLKSQKNCSFVNVWPLMIGKDNLPLPGIYIDDRLHLNPAGYAIWQKAIKKQLLKK